LSTKQTHLQEWPQLSQCPIGAWH